MRVLILTKHHTMLNIAILSFLLVTIHLSIQAQTAEEAEEHYTNFSENRIFGTEIDVIRDGEKLLTMLDKFSPARQTFITFYLANAYENSGQIEKAEPLYLKVIEAEPGYYVPYRALGHYYLKLGNRIGEKLNASKDTDERTKLEVEYYNMRAKALSYLEKDYACDPFEGTLNTINWLMKVVGEQAKPNGFEQRVAKLSENCVSILTDKDQ